MVTRIGSRNRKTRHLKQKSIRTKGKISLTRFLATFENDQQVQLVYEPAYHKGMFFKRFYGKVGKISGKQGSCYFVNIKDQNKAKRLLVHPVHLRGVQ